MSTNQYPKKTTSLFYPNYETTVRAPGAGNPYLNNPYGSNLPPPPPPAWSMQQKRRSFLVPFLLLFIGILCVLLIGTLGILIQVTPHTTTLTGKMQAPTPVPYTARDIIHDFMQAHLSVEFPSTVLYLGIQVPYQPDDIVYFQNAPGYAEWYLSVLPDDAKAKADADYVQSNPATDVSYSKHRCFLLSPIGLEAEAAPYWDVMNTACT